MLIDNRYILGLIVFLAAVIGFLVFKINCKRKEDIIKLLIRRDTLPPAAAGTTWMQGGSCFMKDGKMGRVDGNDCLIIEVL